MLEWFTTIPGILIICGVILLVIAIILFVAGAKKLKKEMSSNTNSNMSNDTVATSSVAIPVEPVTVSPMESVEVTNTDMNNNTNIETSTNVVDEPIHISEPATVSSQIEETQTVEPVINMPTMEMPTEVPEVTSPVTDNSTIYGGEIPTTNFSVHEEKPVTIYGGNDPLEATQTLPKMEEHHVPYGGNYPEAKIVEPVQSVEIPTPVEEVVSAMPTVDSTVEDTIPEPSVIEIPDVEPVAEPVATESESVSQVEVPEPTPFTIPVEEDIKPVVEEL